ncbi:MSN4 (YKL062W) and MSN2 (YMR037C) [Zygosaccharomyces parabailii]|nr:MSN4 (YKL062W) and MSN2 (YMR037C) [Zygosaccharomyces parabailii]
MSDLFMELDTALPEVLLKDPQDHLGVDLNPDSRNDTATSLSLDFSKEGGSSAGGSGSGSGSVSVGYGRQQNFADASPWESPQETAPEATGNATGITVASGNSGTTGTTATANTTTSATTNTGNTNTDTNTTQNAGFIDPNLLSNNLFMDTFGLSPSNEDLNGPDPYAQPNLNSLLDDYVSTEMILNGQGATQDVITTPLPEMTGSRGSISHNVDFWNLTEQSANTQHLEDQISPRALRRPTTPFTGIDRELAEVLNGYHINFRRNSLTANVPQATQRHGFKKQPQRSSMSVLDGSLNTDLFNKLYENGVPSSNLKVLPSWDRNGSSEEEEEDVDPSTAADMPGLEPIVSPKSPKSVSGGQAKNTQRFINPSMVLSDNASASARAATTGTEKIDVAPKRYDIALNPPPNYQSTVPEISTVPTVPTVPTIPRVPAAHSASTGSTGSNGPTLEQQQQQQLQMHAPTKRRRSTANILTISSSNIQNGVTVTPAQAPATNSSGSNSRSITPMSGSDDDAKPFKCRECSKAFRRSEHLKRHIRSVHSSERPFACMFCEKKFSRSDNLSQHLKTHKKHGDF